MISFNCAKCGRHYQVSQALRHIPLLCKGCGERIEVPETSQVLEPEPGLVPTPAPTVPSIAASVKAAIDGVPHAATNSIPESKDHSSVNHIPPDSAAITGPKPPDPLGSIPVSLPLETPADAANTEKTSLAPRPNEDEATDEKPPEASTRMTPLAIAVDVVVGLVLLIIGGLLGEVLARKSTGDVFWDATASVRFPPIDLMLWLAAPVLLLLIHGLLISRKKSAGAWVQRRREARVT